MIAKLSFKWFETQSLRTWKEYNNFDKNRNFLNHFHKIEFYKLQLCRSFNAGDRKFIEIYRQALVSPRALEQRLILKKFYM